MNIVLRAKLDSFLEQFSDEELDALLAEVDSGPEVYEQLAEWIEHHRQSLAGRLFARHRVEEKKRDGSPSLRRQHVIGCGYCAKYAPGDMFPPHDASARCESGRREHCTCGVCF